MHSGLNEVENVLPSDSIPRAQCSVKKFWRKIFQSWESPISPAGTFAEWVKANWGHDIVDDTAHRWLHKLGFNQKRYGKGVYFDGHERDDVGAER